MFNTAILSSLFDPRKLANLVVWIKADSPLITSVTGFTGTGTVAQTTITVTGIGTAFLSEIVVGDKVSGSGFNETVTAIASNTSLTVDTSGTVGAGATFTITPQAGVTDRVTTWSDLSGQGHDFTQATLSKCGILVNAGLNGRPIVRFDVGNDVMSVASFSLVQPEHVFAVCTFNQAFSSNQVIIEGTSANNTIRVARTASGTMSISAGTALNLAGNTPQSPNIYSCEFSGASSAIRINENAFSVSGNAGVGSPGGLVINANAALTANFGGMDLAEVLVYNRILSSGERLQVENYLSKKYALPLTS